MRCGLSILRPMTQRYWTDYRRLFGCEVLFDQPASGLRIREEVGYALPQANEKLLDMLLEHATELAGRDHSASAGTDQVKNLLRLMLKQQTPSSADDCRKAGYEQSYIAAQAGGRGHPLQRCPQ